MPLGIITVSLAAHASFAALANSTVGPGTISLGEGMAWMRAKPS